MSNLITALCFMNTWTNTPISQAVLEMWERVFGCDNDCEVTECGPVQVLEDVVKDANSYTMYGTVPPYENFLHLSQFLNVLPDIHIDETSL